ncbi:MAG TPA: ATP-binding protein [Longimicrobiales bacterium]|nr:ATP-binding protein [Longimicrobiales bacterium]
MQVISLPASLDQQTVDEFLKGISLAGEGRSLLDARHVRWVDPNGMVALLLGGAVARNRQGAMPRLELPESADVLGYLSRMGFFREAQGIYEFDDRAPKRGAGPSDVLLEITPIRANADVHAVVDRVQGRAGAILSSKLGYPASAVVQFSVILSEVCQNIIEHAEAPGWVAAQAYNWARRLGRWVVVISVMDLGRGFRGSLADEHAARYGDRWSDATALEAAFLHGLTRFPDSGRGQGIQQIRRQVQRWNGAITIRSGSARIGQVPEWDDTPPLTEGLAPFPGAQISIVLPARKGGQG